MLQEIINSFVQLVNTIKEKPVATLAAVLLCGITYGTYVNSQDLQHITNLNPSPIIEKGRFERSLIFDDEINLGLEKIRNESGASRVAVRQFHNGRHDLSGLPFTSVSLTYLNLAPGVTIDPIEYQPLPIAALNKTLKEMWVQIDNPKCITKLTTEIADIHYKLSLERNGVKKLYLCPMTNLLHYPIGYIAVGYNHEPAISDQIVLKKLEADADKIVGYLERIKHGENPAKSRTITNLFGLL